MISVVKGFGSNDFVAVLGFNEAAWGIGGVRGIKRATEDYKSKLI